jgi:hypothetical protein
MTTEDLKKRYQKLKGKLPEDSYEEYSVWLEGSIIEILQDVALMRDEIKEFAEKIKRDVKRDVNE